MSCLEKIVLSSIFIIGMSMLLLALRIHLIGPPQPQEESVDKKELLENADNGDIIFLSGNTFGEKTIKWYHGSDWSHCSFVFRDANSKGENIPFIFESDLGQGYRDGPRVMPLEEKLNRWKGDAVVALKKYMGSVTAKKEDILAIATDYYKKEFGFDKKMYAWFFSSRPSSAAYRYLKNPKDVFCSELVADTLQKLNIMDKVHVPSWYTPEYLFSNLENYKETIWCNIT